MSEVAEIDLTEKDYDDLMEEGWGCSDYKDMDGIFGSINYDLKTYGLILQVGNCGDDNIWTRVVKIEETS